MARWPVPYCSVAWKITPSNYFETIDPGLFSPIWCTSKGSHSMPPSRRRRVHHSQSHQDLLFLTLNQNFPIQKLMKVPLRRALRRMQTTSNPAPHCLGLVFLALVGGCWFEHSLA